MALAPAPLVAAVVLAAVYLVGSRLRDASHITAGTWRGWWVSAASGASVAYVFVDILPELGLHQQAFIEAVGENLLFAEQRIYVVALVGFVVFYGLEHMILNSRARHRLYWLHLGGFAAYSWLIGSLLVPRAAVGQLALIFYCTAMVFHFLVLEHSLVAQHGRADHFGGRLVLAACVMAGWLSGATAHVSEPTLARLFAFVAGGVVITSVRAELPDKLEGRFWPFCLGAAAFALLLLNA